MDKKEDKVYDLDYIIGLLSDVIQLKGGEPITRLDLKNDEIPKNILDLVEADLKDYFGTDFLDIIPVEVFWNKKKEFLNECGYNWYSPKDLYPDFHFD